MLLSVNVMLLLVPLLLLVICSRDWPDCVWTRTAVTAAPAALLIAVTMASMTVLLVSLLLMLTQLGRELITGLCTILVGRL